LKVFAGAGEQLTDYSTFGWAWASHAIKQSNPPHSHTHQLPTYFRVTLAVFSVGKAD
jgi:hypothetical protein